MTDEIVVPPEAEPAGEVPLIAEVDEEAIAAARAAAIAANDRDVEAQLRRATRRGFLTAGVAAAVGLAGWKFLRTRRLIDALPRPFHAMLGVNDALAIKYFSPKRLNPTSPTTRITRPRSFC